VFTARYALSLYIKQIRFVFKGLIRPQDSFTCRGAVSFCHVTARLEIYCWDISLLTARTADVHVTVFWVLTPCRISSVRRFEGTYYRLMEGDWIFEDGGRKFFRNVTCELANAIQCDDSNDNHLNNTGRENVETDNVTRYQTPCISKFSKENTTQNFTRIHTWNAGCSNTLVKVVKTRHLSVLLRSPLWIITNVLLDCPLSESTQTLCFENWLFSSGTLKIINLSPIKKLTACQFICERHIWARCICRIWIDMLLAS
jgi:hypothetical protein